MHGDIIFRLDDDDKAKGSIEKLFNDASGYHSAIAELASKADRAQRDAWSLIRERIKEAKKTMPRGRNCVYKDGKVVDVGPAPDRRMKTIEIDDELEDPLLTDEDE